MADNAFTRFGNRLLDPGNLSDENVRQNQQMADILLNQSSNTQPIRSPWQGVAQLAQALNAQVYRQRGERGEKALKDQRAKQLGDFMTSLNLDPNQSQALQSAPDGIRDALLADVAGRQLAPEERDNPYAKINPKDFTPESVAEFDRTGNYDVLRRVESTSGSSVRDQRIADEARRLRSLGVENPEELATAVVDKIVRIDTDPITGLPRRVDLGTGQIRELEVTRPQSPEMPPIDVDQTLWDMAPKATGPAQTAKAGASQVSGPLGGPISEEAVQARQTFGAAQNSVIRAFSLNPRYPVAEQQRIMENINIQPGFWDSTELMRSRMRGMDEFLSNELATVEHFASLPGVDRQQKAADERTAQAIKSFRRQLGVPDEAQSDVPEGVDPELWKFMTPEQKALWQN